MAKLAVGIALGLSVVWGLYKLLSLKVQDIIPYADPSSDETEMVVKDSLGEWHFRGHVTNYIPNENYR